MTDRSRRLLGGAVSVRSAGIAAGRYLSPETIETATEKGLDAETLRPTQLTAEMLREADLIVTMTRDHAAEVLDLAPEVAEKTFTLKELSTLLASSPASEASTQRDGVVARIAELHRRRASGPVAGAIEDVRDPLGLPMEVYREVASDIEAGVDDLVRGLFGVRDRAEASPGGS
jgi:protein-tyrosine phosphatase